MQEIQIDTGLAIKSFIKSATWPLAALGELRNGTLVVPDNEVTVSPR